jgi:RNA polymerase sigma factor (sigma-70 family)
MIKVVADFTLIFSPLGQLTMSSTQFVQVAYGRYHSSIRRYALSALRRHGLHARLVDAEDLVQAAFLKLLEEPEHVSQPEGWLIRCVTNFVGNLRHVTKPVGISEVEGLAEALVRKEGTNPIEEAEERDELDHQMGLVTTVLGRLSPRQRQVIESLYFNGKSREETARQLRLTITKVKSIRQKALKRLR